MSKLEWTAPFKYPELQTADIPGGQYTVAKMPDDKFAAYFCWVPRDGHVNTIDFGLDTIDQAKTKCEEYELKRQLVM